VYCLSLIVNNFSGGSLDVSFSGRVLVLGAGSVAQCTLPLILKHFAKPSQVTVIDKLNQSKRIENEIKLGVTF